MSILVCLDAVRGIPGKIRTIEPILHRIHMDNFIAWFECHLPWAPLDYGPFYEVDPETMDQFIEDCRKAVKEKGWFFEEETDCVEESHSMSVEQYQEALAILTRFRAENEEEWESLWFFYSAG